MDVFYMFCCSFHNNRVTETFNTSFESLEVIVLTIRNVNLLQEWPVSDLPNYFIKKIVSWKKSDNRGRNFDLKTDNKQSLWLISVVSVSLCMNFSPPFRCPTWNLRHMYVNKYISICTFVSVYNLKGFTIVYRKE